MIMRIKELRKKAGLTQTELAYSMKVMQNTVSNWETEIILPRTRQLPDLARALGVTIDDLYVSEDDLAC